MSFHINISLCVPRLHTPQKQTVAFCFNLKTSVLLLPTHQQTQQLVFEMVLPMAVFNICILTDSSIL